MIISLHLQRLQQLQDNDNPGGRRPAANHACLGGVYKRHPAGKASAGAAACGRACLHPIPPPPSQTHPKSMAPADAACSPSFKARRARAASGRGQRPLTSRTSRSQAVLPASLRAPAMRTRYDATERTPPRMRRVHASPRSRPRQSRLDVMDDDTVSRKPSSRPGGESDDSNWAVRIHHEA